MISLGHSEVVIIYPEICINNSFLLTQKTIVEIKWLVQSQSPTAASPTGFSTSRIIAACDLGDVAWMATCDPTFQDWERKKTSEISEITSRQNWSYSQFWNQSPFFRCSQCSHAEFHHQSMISPALDRDFRIMDSMDYQGFYENSTKLLSIPKKTRHVMSHDICWKCQNP